MIPILICLSIHCLLVFTSLVKSNKRARLTNNVSPSLFVAIFQANFTLSILSSRHNWTNSSVPAELTRYSRGLRRCVVVNKQAASNINTAGQPRFLSSYPIALDVEKTIQLNIYTKSEKHNLARLNRFLHWLLTFVVLLKIVRNGREAYVYTPRVLLWYKRNIW